MTFNYAEKRATAEKLITKFGGSGSFVVPGNDGGFDPNTGDNIPAQPDVSIDGIITPALQFKQQEVDGETVQWGDAYVFFHSDNEPPIGALTTINGVTWRCVRVMELTSVDGVNVYRKVQIRKGG